MKKCGRENPYVAEFSFTASETDKVSKIYRAKDIMTTFEVPFYYEIKSKRTNEIEYGTLRIR